MIAAILNAQWAAIRNSRLGAIVRGGLWSLLTNVVWYGFWVACATFAYAFTADPDSIAVVEQALPRGLMAILLYWQIAPVLVASLGASLDLRKLRVFPVPESHLFWIEVLLRFTTGIEMLLILSGSALGMMRNPVSGGWHRVPEVAVPMVLLVALNLLTAAGLRNLIDRLLSHKHLRELIVVLMVMLAAVPQMLLMTGTSDKMAKFFVSPSFSFWPWALTAQLVSPGRAFASGSWPGWTGMLIWVVAAFFFARWQFERSMRFDGTAARAEGDRARPTGFADFFYGIPGRLLPDPVAAVAEKELRTLLRSARFRLVFIMGFTFGLLIWLPIVFGNGNKGGFFGENFLTLVCVYSLTLLGQVTYWNCLGFDRAAAQVYFATPVKFSSALAGKNLAAAFLILIEIAAIMTVCWLLRTPVTAARTAEALAVTVVVATFLFAAGNLASVHMPRAMNPERSAQSSASGKGQALMLLVYPLAFVPAMLAYFGRFAIGSNWAFYGVLAVFGIIAAIMYAISLESAVRTAELQREEIVAELSRGSGPIAAE